MRRADRRLLLETVRSLLDGSDVDWRSLARTRPELTGVLENLERIGSLTALCASGGRPVARSEVGPTWGPLEIRRKIGEGSFGDVFLAYDPILQRDVALKLRRRESQEEGSSSDLTDSRHEISLHEARLLARVRHPNVLTVHGAAVHEGRLGMWMDFLRGETLEERVRSRGSFPGHDLNEVGRDLCRGLAAVHDAGLIHGDIKPANVMAEADGRYVLMDFGAGEDRSSAESRRGGPIFGTPIVMSPELLEGKPSTVLSDIYAVAVVLYRLAANRYPVVAESMDKLHEDKSTRGWTPLRELRPDLPDTFVQAIERGLSPHPEARFETAGAFETALAEPAQYPLGAGATRPVRPNNLRRPTTRFIGRATELGQVGTLLSDHRLVTLVGPAGCGKTRLALQAAHALHRGYTDGCLWVDLDHVTREGGVAQELHRTLGLQESASSEVEAGVLHHLKESLRLLVLDNAEHLLDACAELADRILRSCPRVHILVTSRELLGLPDEGSLRVHPLTLPPENATDSILDFESVRLFLDRAFATRATFSITRGNAESVARICRLLDGVPLALELAAARVDAMETEQIADRLEQSLHLLAGRQGNFDSRHQTVSASIAWSYELLAEEERSLLRRLSVFIGGWTLELAESICSDTVGEPFVGGIELDGLMTRLVEKSLIAFESVRDDEVGSSRYSMLGMVRHFAGRELRGEGESPWRERHLRAYLELGAAAEPGLAGAEQATWLRRLDRERANVGAALEFARATPERVGDGVRLVGSLGRYWIVRGLLREGRDYCRSFLDAMDSTVEVQARVKLQTWAAHLSAALGDISTAVALHEGNRKVCEREGDRRGVAVALGSLGSIAQDRGDGPEAARCLEASLAIFEELGDRSSQAIALNSLGNVARRSGDLPRSVETYARGLALERDLQRAHGIALLSANLGVSLGSLGEHDRARAMLEESIELRREIGDRVGTSISLTFLAEVDIEIGAVGSARERLEEALEIQEEVGHRPGISNTLGVWARLEAKLGRWRRAVQLLGAQDRIREGMAIRLYSGPEQEEQDRFLRRLESELGPEEYQSAWLSGRSMTADRAAALARSEG